ncbi:DNA-binding protein [Psittacine adenovirus 1]|uniref:DNA-binding protein n=1 Tax=Psittacine adenovirus 1 TaxID=318592 RepID=A0A2Z5E1E2_9ADEN|nr:DNA-binding protein [Psittacine adenovirus 1]AXB73052.1 DNA-binding protein [Psittacine adenovirus 1]
MALMESPRAPKRPYRRRLIAPVEDSEDEDNFADMPAPSRKKQPPAPATASTSREANAPRGRKSVREGRRDGAGDGDEVSVSEKDGDFSYRPQDPVAYGAQKAMGMLEKLCNFLDMRWQGATISPEDAIWTKLGGTYMRKKHQGFRLTFSSFESFHAQVGRFLAAMVYSASELEPKFVPGGAHVWQHGWFDGGAPRDDVLPRCLHGDEMVIKPRTVEMNPTSEAGKRAIAEQNATVEKNRYGRQVVVLRFEKNAVCPKDLHHSGFPLPHAHGSCAMVFSDAGKAVSALLHDIAWTKALYPNADHKKTEDCILISTACHCTYAAEEPISGRQVCRIIPYKLSGVADITKEMCKTRKDMEAHKAHPHTLVFNCCNPQSSPGSGMRSASRTRNDKSCAWMISAMDLRYAYVFATELFAAVFAKVPSTGIPEFRWSDKYAFKTDVIAPVNPVTSHDPFA